MNIFPFRNVYSQPDRNRINDALIIPSVCSNCKVFILACNQRTLGSEFMLYTPSNHRRPFWYHTKMADFEYFRVLSVFSWKKIDLSSEKWIEYGKYSDSQIGKPQRGRPKRAELPRDVNKNTGAQSINTERSSKGLKL